MIQSRWCRFIFVVMSVCAAPCAQALAQGTAFTYQGRLHDSGGPATGIFDFQFSIYDAVTNGNLVAGPVTNLAVGVSNGLFTTTIDFGAGVFTGSNYWLAIAVCTNGAGSYIALNPLQPLTPTPYAVFAGTAGSVSGMIPAAQLSGIVPGTNLPAAAVAKIIAGSNVTVSVSGSTYTINAQTNAVAAYVSGTLTNSITGAFGETNLTVSDGDTGFSLLLDTDRIPDYPVATFHPTRTNQSMVVDLMPNGSSPPAAATWLDLVDRDLMTVDSNNWRVVRMGITTNGDATMGTVGWGNATPGQLSIYGGTGIAMLLTTGSQYQASSAMTILPGEIGVYGKSIYFYNSDSSDIGTPGFAPRTVYASSGFVAGTNATVGQAYSLINGVYFPGNGDIGALGLVPRNIYAGTAFINGTNTISQSGSTINGVGFNGGGMVWGGSFLINAAGQPNWTWSTIAFYNDNQNDIGQVGGNPRTIYAATSFVNGTNSISQTGSKLNGVGFTNKVVTAPCGLASYATNTAALAATGWTNTLGIDCTAFITAATTAALSDAAGNAIVTIGTVASFIAVPMRVGWRLTGTGISGAAR